MPSARQGRIGSGGVSSVDVARLASSSDHLDRNLVFDAREAAGKKAAPCLSVKEVRRSVRQLLHEELQSNALRHLCDCAMRLKRRKQAAGFYH
jgi:hypothetical protein